VINLKVGVFPNCEGLLDLSLDLVRRGVLPDPLNIVFVTGCGPFNSDVDLTSELVDQLCDELCHTEVPCDQLHLVPVYRWAHKCVIQLDSLEICHIFLGICDQMSSEQIFEEAILN
jgi:hypothetical protein